MAFGKALALQHMTKWIVIGVVAIIFMMIFFWQFGQFLIPLMLAGLMVFGLYAQSAQAKKPISPVLMVALPLGAFITGYFIQRVSTVALSGTSYITDQTTLVIDQTMSIMLLVFILVIALVFAVSRRRRR